VSWGPVAMSARFRHSIASRGLSCHVRKLCVVQSSISPSEFLITSRLSLPEAHVVWPNEVVSTFFSSIYRSLPQSGGLLEVIQGILVHAEKFICLRQAIPGSVVLLVYV